MKDIETNELLDSCESEHQSDFVDRLKNLIGVGSVSSFAKFCDVPASSMQKYLNGSIPGIDKALRIAEANGVSVQWLITGNENMVQETPAKHDTGFLEDFALIPGYSIQVSAGHGALNLDQLEPSRHLAFRRKWLKFRGFTEKDLVIVWAKGDSMEPTINNNDTLVVHTGRTRPHDGHIYIFRREDELFVKRYQSVPSAWRLISDNPMYDNVDIKKEEQHQFEVIGQVVHIAKDIGD